ncbi:MAG TPA: ribbon-helix-helix protein, CopG family [Chloroflexota bacterium]|nr:ribbon-helix-helix protein, CopG family [Chloroflexota bacterium]
MERTTVYLPRDLRRRLATRARETGRSQADIFRTAVGEYLNQEPEPLPSFFGSISNSDFQAVNTREWLREHWRPDW